MPTGMYLLPGKTSVEAQCYECQFRKHKCLTQTSSGAAFLFGDFAGMRLLKPEMK
jgi:hypothetical protein